MPRFVEILIAKLLPAELSQQSTEESRRAKLFICCAIITLLVASGYTCVFLSFGMKIAACAAAQGIVFIALALLLVRRNQSIFWAGNLLAFTCTLGVGIAVWRTGGNQSAGFSWFYFGPLVATMLAGRRAGLSWYAVALAFVAIFSIAGYHSWLITNHIPPGLDTVFRFVTAAGLVTVVVSAAWSFSVTQESAATRLEKATSLAEAACKQEQIAHTQSRLIVDNVAEGLAIVDLEGRLLGEPSAQFHKWFGRPADLCCIWEWIKAEPAFLKSLEFNWEQLSSAWLPVELTLEQLPKRFESNGRSFNLKYRPVFQDEALHHVLVICADITLELEAERSNALQREQMVIFSHFVRDPYSIRDFLSESERLVSALSDCEGSAADQARWLHTLKGNCGIFGLESFASWLHELENELAQADTGMEVFHADAIECQWSAIRARLSGVFDVNLANKVILEADDLQKLMHEVQSGASRPEILLQLQRWTWEPVHRRLEFLAERAILLAQALGKEDLNVRIEGKSVRFPASELWSGFWSSIVHVIRNAIDHGIEPAHVRLQAGKKASGQLTLRAYESQEAFVFEVTDDGAGISWEKLREKCVALGMEGCSTQAGLTEAVFADGLSTRDVATETSGRGVGMSAVRAACHDLGGQIEIESQPGKGTTFRFLFAH